MSPVAEQVLQAARALSQEEQRDVIDALLVDLKDPTIEYDWLEEIRRRSAEFDAGHVQPIPWSQVKAEARQGDVPRG